MHNIIWTSRFEISIRIIYKKIEILAITLENCDRANEEYWDC